MSASGQVLVYYGPKVEPNAIRPAIEEILNEWE